MDWLWLLILLLIVVIMIPVIAIQLTGFSRERRYLLMEIRRTEGKERKRWKKRLRRLYIRTFTPFRPKDHS